MNLFQPVFDIRPILESQDIHATILANARYVDDQVDGGRSLDDVLNDNPDQSDWLNRDLLRPFSRAVASSFH